MFAWRTLDRLSHDAYTGCASSSCVPGATNIADYLAGRRGLNMDRLAVSIGLGLALAALAWWSARAAGKSNEQSIRKSVPDTDVLYWFAMLTAGVFGTVLGDYAQKLLDRGMAAAVLTVVLAVALLIRRRPLLRAVYAYWLVIGVVNTTGTAIGDWLAGSKILKLGLPLSTMITGFAFVAVLALWRSRPLAGGPATPGRTEASQG